MDFPGNSHAARKIPQPEPEKSETPEQPEEITKKVVTGKVGIKKKPVGLRLKEMFVVDGGSFAEHLVENVVVPMVKDMALSIVTQIGEGFKQSMEQRIFGSDTRSTSVRTGYGSGSHVNYSRYSAKPTPSRSGSSVRTSIRSPRASNRVELVILESREDADLVLEELGAVIDSIGHCTVGDYYGLVKIRPESTDEEWGWTSLRAARVNKVGPMEYQITMPPSRPINYG